MMARKQTIRSADSTIFVRGLDEFRAELKRLDTTAGEGYRKELGRANREIGELVKRRAADQAQTKPERKLVGDMKTSAAVAAARIEIGNGDSAAYAFGAEFGAYRNRRRLIKNTGGRATIVRNNERLSKVIRRVESQTLAYDRYGGTSTVRKKAREAWGATAVKVTRVVIGWNQFRPWRGNKLGAGYVLFPTLRKHGDEIANKYMERVLDIASRAFNSGGSLG
jgi:hypothetical protein